MKSTKKFPAASIPRRRFFANGIAGIALTGLSPLIVARHVLGQGYQAPSDTLRIAAVGIGGMGRSYLEGCKSERIVALCDLDHNRPSSQEVFKSFPAATRYHDFREMLDKEAKNFDALIVATPDHTHAVILMAAIQLGKHTYGAKPITHTIAEARKVKAAILASKKLVTQSSIQSAGNDAATSTSEMLLSGVLGPIREVHIWCDHPAYPCALLRPKDAQTPPPGMDWDLWLGPAPFRPFNSAYHPELWRPWWDFGAGTVGDMACHTLHIFFKELQLGAPTTVYGYGSRRYDSYFKRTDTPECQGVANMVTWEFPARGSLSPLKVHWYDGGMKPICPDGMSPDVFLRHSGVLFIGEKGMMVSGFYGSAKPVLLAPAEKFHDFQPPPKTLPRVKDHYREWTEACKTGGKTTVPLELGCEFSEMALLGALALRNGAPLAWDAKAAKVTNDDDANELLDPPRRPGWSLP